MMRKKHVLVGFVVIFLACVSTLGLLLLLKKWESEAITSRAMQVLDKSGLFSACSASSITLVPLRYIDYQQLECTLHDSTTSVSFTMQVAIKPLPWLTKPQGLFERLAKSDSLESFAEHVAFMVDSAVLRPYIRSITISDLQVFSRIPHKKNPVLDSLRITQGYIALDFQNRNSIPIDFSAASAAVSSVQPLYDVSATGEITADSIALHFKSGGFDSLARGVHVRGNVGLYNKTQAFLLKASMLEENAAPHYTGHGEVSGSFSAEVTGRGVIDFQRLSLPDYHFEVEARGLDLIAENTAIQKQLVVLLVVPTLKVITFDSLQTRFVSTPGGIVIDTLFGTGQQLNLRASGKISAKGWVTVPFEVALKKVVTDHLASFVVNALDQNPDGTRSMHGTITGTRQLLRMEIEDDIVKRGISGAFKSLKDKISQWFE